MSDLGRTETVTFLRGEDEAELRRLDAEVQRTKPVKGAAPATLDEGDAHATAREQREKFAAEAEGRGTVIVMRSVGRKTWRRVLSEHPPRDGNADDAKFGANADTFGEAIVSVCLASPTFGTDEEREAFLDGLSEAQFGRLEVVAFTLNTTLGANPKASPA